MKCLGIHGKIVLGIDVVGINGNLDYKSKKAYEDSAKNRTVKTVQTNRTLSFNVHPYGKQTYYRRIFIGPGIYQVRLINNSTRILDGESYGEEGFMWVRREDFQSSRWCI